MGIIKTLKAHDPELFEYLPADEVHPHDGFINWTFLRFIPHSVTPNQVTFLRLLLTPVVFYLVMQGMYRAGVILFGITALTDAIDGSLARTRDQITRFGMLFDPLVDKFLIGSMVLLLVFRYFDPLLGIAILGLEILFIAGAAIAKIRFKKTTSANRWGKIKMLLQVVAMSLTMLALLIDFPVLLSIAAWCFGLAIGFAVLSLFKGGF